MKRRFHWSLPAGLLLAIAGIGSFPFLAQFPVTRPFAWLNQTLLAAGVILMGVGIVRAVRQPQLFRGKILGAVLGGVSLLALAFFAVGIFYLGRVPQPIEGLATGRKAPEFSLPDQDNKPVSLEALLSSPNTKGALLIFYRGFW